MKSGGGGVEGSGRTGTSSPSRTYSDDLVLTI